jgi:alpha/beta hydrolase fold
MAELTTRDGTQIFFKDWGSGEPIVFSHGWPLSSDDWDAQMLFFLHHGYRVIAHDQRGHGRSGQPSEGNDFDHYADDLADLVQHLDLHDAIHIGHLTGPGLLDHDGAVPYALPERADFEDNPLRYYAFRVEWLSLVLLREPVDMVSGRLASYLLAYDAADGRIMA